MESEYEAGKIFVGGLSWNTTNDSMRKYFENFGEVTECVVMKDPLQPPEMKKNRGFGFVRFQDPAAVDKVVQRSVHMLDDKSVDPKKAQKKSSGRDTDKKVFLGGLATDTTKETVEEYFTSNYGGVTEVTFKEDRETQRKRGFGFVVFESVDYVERVLQKRYHLIDGKKVEVKKAEPRSATASAMRQTNPALTAYYQQPYGDYRSANNGHHYPGQWGEGAQPYYNAYPHPPPPPTGYGQHYSNTANYYDPSAAYPPTQPSSTGDRQDTQSYYQQQPSNPYGHGGAQQLGAYGQDTTSYTGRSAYPAAQDSYGRQTGGYGHGVNQQQSRYGGRAGGY